MHAEDGAQEKLNSHGGRVQPIADFLSFLLDAKSEISNNLSAAGDREVKLIREVVEEQYTDDRGDPAMYQRLESSLYDDAREVVTLLNFFERYDSDQLRTFQSLLNLDLDGLTGDRHPRKVFDRSPFGIASLVVGTITVWMTILRTYTGEDLSELLELIRFNWIAGSMWIVGLFVVLWYILKTVRNNRQVALLATISRSLEVYFLHKLRDVP